MPVMICWRMFLNLNLYLGKYLNGILFIQLDSAIIEKPGFHDINEWNKK